MNWLGAAILVLASYICGNMLSAQMQEQTKILSALISLLEYMRRRMLSERAPLHRIFCDFDSELLERIGFITPLRTRRSDISEIWNSAVKKLSIGEESKGELSLLGISLGRVGLDEQIKRLDACISFLESEQSKLRVALPPKQKSTKTVCLLFGLLTAIILL